MKFCQTHWDKLREAIRARGLWDFVAKSNDHLITKMEIELEDETKSRERTTFEPLINAHMAIVSNVMGTPLGLGIMIDNEDGSERCPLCFVQCEHDKNCKIENCTATFEGWIDHAANDQLAIAKSLGLVDTS